MTRKILGTYAQTEMGHGSNVRGLETTATYDPDTQEFVVHSPTLSATKWWPAHLGFGCTHAIVYARMILKDVDHGVLPFMVQLRNMDSYEPLPGIQLGTSGPTIGHYANEHGRCRFDQVRIPRDHLCMRWQQVAPDGVYTAPARAASKTSYITMTNTRVGFVTIAHRQLAKALTIAIRYSAQRKQGYPAPGLPETTVLDYQMQQHSLLTLLSHSYALKFAAIYVTQFAERAMEQLESGEEGGFLAMMPELHATTSGLKALSTTMCCEGIEVARKCCGGHGYGLYSGMPQIYLNTLRSQTVEGDNNVMFLQVSRFLIKSWNEAKLDGGAGLAGNVTYLKDPGHKTCSIRGAADWLKRDVQLAAFGHWARRSVMVAAEKVNLDVSAGVPMHEAQNEHMFELINMARTHSYYSILNAFQEALSLRTGPGSGSSAELGRAMKRQCDLFALSILQADIGGVTLDGYVNQQQVDYLSEQVRSLLKEIRPDAVALVDAFDFDDVLELHQTALGRYDGNPYERLWEWSEKDPANNEGAVTGAVPPGFDGTWKPVLDSYEVSESNVAGAKGSKSAKARL